MANWLKRRTIGPAYERCPAEQLAEWSRLNILILTASAIGVVVWWNGVDALVIFFNWLVTGGADDKYPPFDPDAWYSISARLIGSAIIMIIMFVRSKAR